MRYADSNVQAWAQYYAQGGKDPTGAVYFISVPGVKDPVSPQPAPPQPPAAATSTTTIITAANSNPGQSPVRQSLIYNPHGATGTGGGDQTAEDDLLLPIPCDGIGGTDQTHGADGAGPYYGLTRDMTGMDIRG